VERGKGDLLRHCHYFGHRSDDWKTQLHCSNGWKWIKKSIFEKCDLNFVIRIFFCTWRLLGVRNWRRRSWKIPLVFQWEIVRAQGGQVGTWRTKQPIPLRLLEKHGRQQISACHSRLQLWEKILVRCQEKTNRWIGNATGMHGNLGHYDK